MPAKTDIEKRSIVQPVERRSASDDKVTVAGYAAVFGEMADIGGYFQEVLARGAFTNTLKTADVRAFYGHERTKLLGRTSSGTLRLQEDEAAQIAMVFGGEPETGGLIFRFAIETKERGGIERVVFLALKGEEGTAHCFWPVPLPPPTPVLAPAPRVRMPVQPPALQLPLLPGVAPSTPLGGRRRGPRRSAA